MSSDIKIPGRSKATIADMGDRLCIGHKDTNLELRSWTTDEEMELGELAEKHKGASMWKTLEMVVSTMVANFGGERLWKQEGDSWKPLLSASEREITLQGKYFADMLLAYLHIRIAAMGPDLTMTLQDPYDGGKEFQFYADLRTIVVDLPADRNDMTFVYELLQPVQRNGKTIRSLVLAPHRWAVHTAYETSNRLMVPLDMAAGAVAEIPDLIEGPFSVDRKIMASLRIGKRDLSAIAQALEDAAYGPSLMIEAISPKNGKMFQVPIDWQYTSFFKASSR